MITAAQLKAVAPRCDAGAWLPALNAAADEFGIDTPARLSHWLAQLAHESAGFTRLVESLNYSGDALLATFSRARLSAGDARRYGRSATQKADQAAIANRVYGGQWGALNLGNRLPTDGWRYRGRGPIQTTGRRNYETTGKRLGIDLLAEPELLTQPKVGARAAAAFWVDRGLNRLADAGDLTAITQRINGGQIGADDRARLLALATGAQLA